MQYIAPDADGSRLSFAEFLDVIKGLFPLDSDEKIADCVAPLKALSNSTEDLVRTLASQLLANVAGTTSWQASPTSFVLFQADGEVVRMNVWKPLPPASRFNQFNSRLYSYGFPHDHDFDLLTVGGLGPGYETDIFEYDRDAVTGFPGERIRSQSKGRFRLARGAVLFYEQSKDVHIQHPCASTSISINLISARRKLRQGGQFIFDSEASEIRGLAENYGTRILKVVDVVLASGVSDAEDLVEEIGLRNPDPFVRRGIVEQLSYRRGIPREAIADQLGYANLSFAEENLYSTRSFHDMVVHI